MAIQTEVSVGDVLVDAILYDTLRCDMLFTCAEKLMNSPVNVHYGIRNEMEK